MKLVSVVVPVYQNESNLRDTIPKLLTLRDLLPGYGLELVFVDDGSRDASLAILEEFHALEPEVIRVVKLSRNFGQTPATQAGLSCATGDCVAIISADLQEPFEMIPTMVKLWADGHRFIVAYRGEREESARHQFVSNSYWTLLRKFGMRNYPPTGYDYCLIDRQVVDDVNRAREKNTSIFPLIFWLGYRPMLIPITRSLRRAGSSQWNLSRKLRLTADSLVAFTHLPIRIVMFSAIGTSILSIAYFIFVLGRWILRGGTGGVEGWTSLILVMLFLGSMTLFALTVACEYLWRILDEVRPRSPFVIDRIWAKPDHRDERAAV